MEMSLEQKQSQKQILSQKMLQSVEILQMNAQELTDFIKELSLENPVVDIEEAALEDKTKERIKKLEWLAGLDEQNRTYYQYDKDDSEDYLNNIGGDDRETLADALLFQLMTKDYSDTQMAVFEYIANSLDSSGYFTEGLEELVRRFDLSLEQAEECLQIMKGLEPAGVCADSLQECLAIQMEALGADYEVEQQIIAHCMEQLGKNQLPAIAKQLAVSLEEVKAAVARIKKLNPRPAQGFERGGMMRYTVPDVTVVKFQNRFEILQNNYTYPSVRVNREYLQMLKSGCDPEVKEYLTEKLNQVEQVQEAIERRSSTLLNLARCLVEEQAEFFLGGPRFLKPFLMQEAAERLSVHESTISRTVKGKYLQCSWGIYPLNYFFERGMHRFGAPNDEEETQASGTVKQRMRELIAQEDKQNPYSDQQLSELLEQEGVSISRRTVMKYREAMEIANSRGRRQY